MSGVFERLDDQPRAATEAAHSAATGLGHNYLGTEHLLLGISPTPMPSLPSS